MAEKRKRVGPLWSVRSPRDDLKPGLRVMEGEKVVEGFCTPARRTIEIVWHQVGIVPHPIFDTQGRRPWCSDTGDSQCIDEKRVEAPYRKRTDKKLRIHRMGRRKMNAGPPPPTLLIPPTPQPFPPHPPPPPPNIRPPPPLSLRNIDKLTHLFLQFFFSVFFLYHMLPVTLRFSQILLPKPPHFFPHIATSLSFRHSIVPPQTIHLILLRWRCPAGMYFTALDAISRKRGRPMMTVSEEMEMTSRKGQMARTPAGTNFIPKRAWARLKKRISQAREMRC